MRQEKVVTQTNYNLVRKVAFDSCSELSLDIVNHIFTRGSATRKSLVADLQIPPTRVHQIINDFVQLGVVVNNPSTTNRAPHRNPHHYYLNEEIEECLSSIKVKVPVETKVTVSLTKRKKR